MEGWKWGVIAIAHPCASYNINKGSFLLPRKWLDFSCVCVHVPKDGANWQTRGGEGGGESVWKSLVKGAAKNI